jgi:riboflavin biosynthesis pyrimidine reductase
VGVLFDPPITSWLDRAEGPALPMPSTLTEAYDGPLRFPADAGAGAGAGAYVIADFVESIDGVTSFGHAGHADGGSISGFSEPDRFILGLLRSWADAIVVGAETVRREPRDRRWAPDDVFPAAAADYADLRRALGAAASPVTVIVTGRGDLDQTAAALNPVAGSTLVLTTDAGASRLAAGGDPARGVTVATLGAAAPLSARDILDAIVTATGARRVLVEGGAHLFGALAAEGEIDELFVTVAPQIAGRSAAEPRPGLIEGMAFAPRSAPWTTLLSGKASGSHLFLRYRFERA